MTQPEELRAIAKEIRTISKDTYHPAVTNSQEYTVRLGNCANRLDVIAGPETNLAAPVYQPAPYYADSGMTEYRGVQRRVAWRPINFPDRRVHSDTHVGSCYPTYNGPQRRTANNPINFADRRVHGNTGYPKNLVGYNGQERRTANVPINFVDRRIHGFDPSREPAFRVDPRYPAVGYSGLERRTVNNPIAFADRRVAVDGMRFPQQTNRA
jgi:hypothetical protein